MHQEGFLKLFSVNKNCLLSVCLISSPLVYPALTSLVRFHTTEHLFYFDIFELFSMNLWGGRVVQWCWVNFQCRGILLRIRVGQGPTVLAVGAGGGCLDIFFSCLSFLFSFSLSLGDGPI